MPALYQSAHAKGAQGVPYPECAGDVVSHRSTYAFAGNEAVNSIIEMGILPANCRLVDCILDSDDLDTNGAPLIALDVGIMSGEAGKNDNTRTCDASIIAASQIARTGGVARPTLASAFRIAPISTERGVGVKIQTAAATGAAGSIGLTLIYATA